MIQSDTPRTRSTPKQVPVQPRLGLLGWFRWSGRQLTSMRTALTLLLALALAAVPGSLVPQRSADPNGVTQYFDTNPDLAPILDRFQLFDVYSSVWFSSIYLLLFVSLIGCVLPRTVHHVRALRRSPPRTPANLRRLPEYRSERVATQLTGGDIVTGARAQLRRAGYRVKIHESQRPASTSVSVSAERGYLKETGNLVFHISLLGILIGVGIGGGLGFNGQRVIVEGQTFVNSLASYDSFSPGRFFNVGTLDRYSLRLDSFDVDYEQQNLNALGQPLNYTADVTPMSADGEASSAHIRVNEPLRIGSTDVYLLGNGYAPQITVRDPEGTVVFSDEIPFLPQDSNLTSLGVVKVPDGLAEQIGMIGFFYPTQSQLSSGAYLSVYPDLTYPVATFNVYEGDLGLDGGIPRSVYSLDTTSLNQLTGGETGVDSIELKPGETQALPRDLGTVSLDSVKRFASFEVHSDPAQGWVLAFSILAVAGLMLALLTPRRRIWVKATQLAEETVLVEYAGLARGDDPGLNGAIVRLHKTHSEFLTDAQKATE